ncbi:hypothetical protein KO02_16190 [Sphingobacterium sp. ML3W]|uniref:Crp/Fnr family transcriptional regulator n=1 Tax=Sphingobacterium sp. ML3W TaxID=1538644 RepID=UPI0004F6E775|nr:Crp/Fnr family transcriptional regulator [Sphingobacterium sp. ML3W]AIM38052.1 hypothetical protein KO02_16190 [Sphingobacterium sp. ML3W]
MNDLKQKLLLSYLQSKLLVPAAKQPDLMERAVQITRIQKALKNQVLESPGPAAEGRAWLSVNAMVHSYYFNEKTQSNIGTYIWEKNEPIIFNNSLFQDMPRNHTIQMIEAGPVLSMSYQDLLDLRNAFPEIAQHMEELSIQKEQSYQDRIILLNAPTQERIIHFEADNPLFSQVANSTIKAMHLGICRQTYDRAKKQIKNQK